MSEREDNIKVDLKEII